MCAPEVLQRPGRATQRQRAVAWHGGLHAHALVPPHACKGFTVMTYSSHSRDVCFMIATMLCTAAGLAAGAEQQVPMHIIGKQWCGAGAQLAPGVDLERDVLGQMDFRPLVKDVKLMDARCFSL